MKFPLSSYFKNIGPGIITAALIFGPGSLTINIKLGSSFGYSLLWVLVVSMIFMSIFTSMSARIGLFSNTSLINRLKFELNRPIAIVVGIGIFLVTASFQAGNTIGSSVAFSEMFGLNVGYWIAVFTFIATSLLFFKSFYKVLEKLMLGLVILMLTSFILSIVMSAPDWSQVIKGLIPSIPKGSEYLIITLTASSFSIVGAFYQSYLTREKGWSKESVKECLNESQTGVIILGLLSTLVMLCAAAVLNANQINVSSASDLGKALEPLFGPFTSTAFMVGFFSASFSSMVGNATIGGVILSDTFFSESSLSSTKVRGMIILVILIGACVALIFGRLPLQLIIFAQGITIMIVPLAAYIIILFSGFKRIEPDLRNATHVTIIGFIGLTILVGMSVYSINYLFF
ncbi:MAG: Nramp family divalent metal transporter [Cyclobacteriaceae bacterium]